MSIHVRCRCGNAWQVDDDLVGKQLLCPACDERVAVAPKTPPPSPVSGAVVSCGLLASSSAGWLCGTAILFFLAGKALFLVQLIWISAAGVFLGGLFGGYFVASLAGERKMRHCWVTSLLTTLFAGAWALLFTRSSLENAMSYQEYIRNPDLVGRMLVTIPWACLISILIGGLSERTLASIAKSLAVRRRWIYTTWAGQPISVFGPQQHTRLAFLWRAIALERFAVA